MKRKTIRMDARCFDLLQKYDGRGGGVSQSDVTCWSMGLGLEVERALGAEGLKRCARLAKKGERDELLDVLCDALEPDSVCGDCGEAPCVCDSTEGEAGGEDAGDDSQDSGGRSLAPPPGAATDGADASTDPDLRGDGDANERDPKRGDPGEESDDPNREGGAISNLFRRATGG